MMHALSRRLSPAAAILLATLTVGALDAIDAFVFFGLRGVSPVRILQSIASGVLGAGAYQGGARTAALGLLLHFVVAGGIAVTYFAATRMLPALHRRPLIFGALYGLAAYGVMTFVVLPLSASGMGGRLPPTPVLINGLLIHMLGVGIPSALFARAAADFGTHAQR
jgi:hypothetical protein